MYLAKPAEHLYKHKIVPFLSFFLSTFLLGGKSGTIKGAHKDDVPVIARPPEGRAYESVRLRR